MIPGLRKSPGEGIGYPLEYSSASLAVQLVKNPPSMREIWVQSLGCGRSPGEGKGYPLQYFGLENPMNCIIHGVTKSWTQLSNLHFTTHTSYLSLISSVSHLWIFLILHLSVNPYFSEKKCLRQPDNFASLYYRYWSISRTMSASLFLSFPSPSFSFKTQLLRPLILPYSFLYKKLNLHITGVLLSPSVSAYTCFSLEDI